MQLLPQKVRHPQIEMESKYLSLRFNLNAFDRCFHFYSESTLNAFRRFWEKKGHKSRASIQDYLRHRSRRLLKGITECKAIQAGRATMNEPPRALTASELSWVSHIIGKQYRAGVTIDHRCYETQGRSVLLSTTSHQYTEAFAGSGESLVVNLVTEVCSASDNSLLLLDEPETSLHPGAQRRLMTFLLDQTLRRKLQVVISTHSSELVRDLPQEAIRVFRPYPDGRILVDHTLSATEAFFVIGQTTPPAHHIIAEDKLAADLIEAVIRSHDEPFRALFRVEFRAGGVPRLLEEISVWMATQQSKPVFMFDGDQVPVGGIRDPQKLTRAELTKESLDNVIQAQWKPQTPRLPQSSNMSEEEAVDVRMQFLRYTFDQVQFLPFANPEDAIWNPDVCRLLVEANLGPSALVQAELAAIESLPMKKRYAKIADSTRIPVESVHQFFLRRFENLKPQAWIDLDAQLRAMVVKANA